MKSSKPSHNSVPTLCYRLSVPPYPIVHTISAPASPRKEDLLLMRYPECDEIMPWPDCTPLLKVTKPPDSDTCV